MQILSITEARSHLTQLADQLQKENEAIEITNHGKPVLALLPWDLYESIEETLEILADEKLAKSLRKSIEQTKKGHVSSFETVKKELGLK